MKLDHALMKMVESMRVKLFCQKWQSSQGNIVTGGTTQAQHTGMFVIPSINSHKLSYHFAYKLHSFVMAMKCNCDTIYLESFEIWVYSKLIARWCLSECYSTSLQMSQSLSNSNVQTFHMHFCHTYINEVREIVMYLQLTARSSNSMYSKREGRSMARQWGEQSILSETLPVC